MALYGMGAVVCPWNRRVNVPPPALHDIRWISLYCREEDNGQGELYVSDTIGWTPDGPAVDGECTVCMTILMEAAEGVDLHGVHR